MLNFFRGGYYLLNDVSYKSFVVDSWMMLSAYDSLFILPVCVMVVNYLILIGSGHPFLMNMVRK